MEIKSEMLKYAAAIELNNPEQFSMFFFSLFSFHFRLYVCVCAKTANDCMFGMIFTDQEKYTHTHITSWKVVMALQPKTKYEMRGNKNNKPQTMRYTQTHKCLQPYENHILRKCVCVCVLSAQANESPFFSCYCLFLKVTF